MLKLLLPTDFSDASYNAIVYALSMFEDAEAEFDVLHAIFYEGKSEDDPDLRLLVKEAEKKFAAFSKKICATRGKAPAHFHFHTAHGLQVSHVINDYARKHKMDLTITGARGEFNSDHTILGGRTSELINLSSIPVLSIPEKVTFHKIKNIIYATDLSDIDFEARELVAFAKLFKASVHFVHVFPELLGTTRFNPQHITNDLIKKFKYPNLTFDAIMNNEVEESLIDFIAEKKPDMVAVFTHKRTLFEQLFNKSVTKKVAFQIDIPLFAFKKKEVATA